jgi:hypothetical protein
MALVLRCLHTDWNTGTECLSTWKFQLSVWSKGKVRRRLRLKIVCNARHCATVHSRQTVPAIVTLASGRAPGGLRLLLSTQAACESQRDGSGSAVPVECWNELEQNA